MKLFKHVALGIDIGTHSIKLVELTRSSGAYYVSGVSKIKLAESGEFGPDDADKVYKACIEGRMRTTGVALNVAQRSMILRYLHVPPCPHWRLKALMNFEIEETAERLEGAVASDFRVVKVPGRGEEMCVMLGLAKNVEVMENYSLLAATRMGIKYCTPASLAIFNVFLHSQKKIEDRKHMIVNIGHTQTDFVLSDGRELQFARSVSFGGLQFTQAVADDLNISLEEAESKKIREGRLAKEDRFHRGESVDGALAGALESQASQLVSLLRSSLTFAATQTKMEGNFIPEQIFISGGGAKLAGLREYIERNMQVPVDWLNPWNTIQTSAIGAEALPVVKELPSDFAAAAGLALCALDPNAVFLDILPVEIKARREFINKNLFTYISLAACILTMVCAFAFQFVNGMYRKQEEKQHTQAQSDLQNRKARFAQVQSQIENIRRQVDVVVSRAAYGRSDAFQILLKGVMESLYRHPEVELVQIDLKTEPGAKDDPAAQLTGVPLAQSVCVVKGVVWAPKHQTSNKSYEEFRNELQSLDVIGPGGVHAVAGKVNPQDKSYAFEVRIDISGKQP